MGLMRVEAQGTQLEDNYRFGPKKIKRRRVLSNHTGHCVFIGVGGRISVPFILSTGTLAALLFPAWPTLSQPPDSSSLRCWWSRRRWWRGDTARAETGHRRGGGGEEERKKRRETKWIRSTAAD
ncbi:unnamed protein product [Pleuronectes platessa]|uniref:Uncharacterized protein n=1 Tax=Pleuronectes platessa TaxID=8262 RepID=A0A9N7VMS7_PLEPL|nr:unnamed protein product [Pleuronectes platessa]